MALTPGATYIISYHTNVGFYSADGNFFANALTNGPLTAPSNSASGGNGVYAYGAGSSFPSNTFGATNYWVDVVFSATTGGPVQPPVANNDSGFTTSLNTAIGIAAANLLANDTDPQGLSSLRVTNGPITAPSSVTAGGNRVYIYGSAVAFPKNTYQASNYWVDVVFG